MFKLFFLLLLIELYARSNVFKLKLIDFNYGFVIWLFHVTAKVLLYFLPQFQLYRGIQHMYDRRAWQVLFF